MSPRFALLSAALVAALTAATGCGTRCTPSDAPHCDGNTLIFCPTPGVDQFTPTVLEHDDCKDKVCVIAGGRGLCALSATPAPACDGGDIEVCENATSRFRCSDGIALDRDPCKSCSAEPDAGILCVGGPDTACVQDADCATGLTCQNHFCFPPVSQ